MTATDNERSYHNTESEYSLPNEYVPFYFDHFNSHHAKPENRSSIEHARLEQQAAGLAELMHNKVIHAPLVNPQRLLDIGCGTGAVTYHLSQTFPSAPTIYGIDLSPVPPIRSETPPNIAYIQGDVRQLSKIDARLASGSFDYIFSRLLICGMTNWASYLSNTVIPLLKPGGWAEAQELDYVWYKNGAEISADWRWLKVINEGAQKKGLDLHCGSHMAGLMQKAGLVDVSVRRYAVPFGTWGEPESRRIGKQQADQMPELYESLIPRLVEGLGLSEKEVGELVRESGGCLGAEEGKEWPLYVTVGRRPLV